MPPPPGSGLCGLWETLPALAGEPGGPQQEITVQPGRGAQWALTKYLGNAASSWQMGRGGGRQLLSSPSQVAEVRGVGAPSPGVPTWFTHGWQAWCASPLPASCLEEQGWPERERAARIPCHPPTHTQHGQGVTLSVPLPHWGGPPQDQPITSYWQSWSWESRPGPAAPGPGHFPPGPPPSGAPRACQALISWARVSVYCQPLLWRQEPGGVGGAGASGWKSEALGSACLMKKEEPSGTLKF